MPYGMTWHDEWLHLCMKKKKKTPTASLGQPTSLIVCGRVSATLPNVMTFTATVCYLVSEPQGLSLAFRFRRCLNV